MVIPTKCIIYDTQSSSYGEHVYSDLLESKDFIILMLVVLYHNKKISRKQFSIYCNRYFNSAPDILLHRSIKTHRSIFTGKWYNDTSFLTVVLEGILEYKHQLIFDINIVDMLDYLNIAFNRNKNWCINYIALSWIKPIILATLNGCKLAGEILQSFDIPIDFISYEDADRKYVLDDGYCCKDCDGCLYEYKFRRYERRYAPNREKIFNCFRKILENYKTHDKNPVDSLYLNFA